MIPEIVLQAGLALLVFGLLALEDPIVARLASLGDEIDPVGPEDLE